MRRILVSAGEASGDLYASLVVEELRRILPETEFFGCTGPRLRAAGVRQQRHVNEGGEAGAVVASCGGSVQVAHP